MYGESHNKVSKWPVQRCNYETADNEAREQLRELSFSKRL